MIGFDAILQSDNVDQIHFEYGPMLKAMSGKEWVLAAHAVKVADGAAKSNLFKVTDAF